MVEKKEIQRKVSFLDKNRVRFEIIAEITWRNKYREFTLTGDGNGGSGQCYDSIKPDNMYQKELLDTWSKYHLKEVDEDFWDTLEVLFDDIEEAEDEKLQSKKVFDCSDDELGGYDDRFIALGIHLDLTFEELDDIEPVEYGYGNCSYNAQGTEYYCGDDEEIDEAVTEYIENNLWVLNRGFLGSYGALADIDYSSTEKILIPLQESCESGNDAILALVDWSNNKEEIVTDAINTDGIGYFLNGYDGSSYEEDVNGTTYFMCRQ